jgi:hypothetical protein
MSPDTIAAATEALTMSDPVSHHARPAVEELRELRDIARREHGPNARSTRHIEAFLHAEERSAKEGKAGAAQPSQDRS